MNEEPYILIANKYIALKVLRRLKLRRREHCSCVYTFPGPRPNTVGDFWKMVWQEKVATIIMLTNLKEGKKVDTVIV